MWTKFLKAMTYIALIGGILLSLIVGVNAYDESEMTGIIIIVVGILASLIYAGFIIIFIEMAENIQETNEYTKLLLQKLSFKERSASESVLHNTASQNNPTMSGFVSNNHISAKRVPEKIEKWTCESCGYVNYSGSVCSKCGKEK